MVALKVLPESEQESAATLIDDLREENRLLRIELEAVTQSRDRFQAENAQLKKQVFALMRKSKSGN
jgi:FtsZ-binding cell division protein ZapB